MMRWRLALGALAAAAAFSSAARSQTAAPGMPATGARLDRSAFAHQRRIPAGPPGAASLRLDAAVLAHSRVSDVRIVTRDGDQVPYLCEAAASPVRVTLSPLQVVDGADVADSVSPRLGRSRSVYALVLPGAHLPASHLVLETAARVFDREVDILAQREDARGPRAGGWRMVGSGRWVNADPDRGAPPLVLEIPPLGTTMARLIVDEGDNRPLVIGRATLEVPTWELRFFREAAEDLWLVYGNDAIDAPRYDLALLAPRLRDTSPAEATADPEAVPVPYLLGFPPTLTFYVTLGVAVVALLLLVARLLTQPR
jgi:hypothetical protein